MAMPTGYSAYQNNKIMTASPAELTLMLYEGAIKFCNIAIMGIEQNDVQKAHTNITKVEAIIEEFRSTLDFKYPVAKDLMKYINICMTDWCRPISRKTKRLWRRC